MFLISSVTDYGRMLLFYGVVAMSSVLLDQPPSIVARTRLDGHRTNPHNGGL
jgi:hypothetical protein